jgi:hypothetical protein
MKKKNTQIKQDFKKLKQKVLKDIYSQPHEIVCTPITQTEGQK